jgi:hypothetical protein
MGKQLVNIITCGCKANAAFLAEAYNMMNIVWASTF